jgi:two-component system OmpR family sensor kinase
VNTRSLKFRLVVWYAGCLTALFLVFGVFVYDSLKHHLRDAQRQALTRRARQVAELAQRMSADAAALSATIRTTFASEANNRFTRVTIDGVVTHVSGAPADSSFDPAEVPLATSPGKDEDFELRAMPRGQGLFIVTTRRTAHGRELIVEEGTSSGALRNTLHDWLVALSGGLLVLICGASAGGYVLVHRSLTPVDQIIRTAEGITLRNLNDRLPVAHSGDELERLSLALNTMIERLDDSFQHTRRFLADASHELRTPLTIIHADLENLAETAEDPEIARAAGSALEETQRLQKIVEALFTLSRFDAGEAVQETVPVDLRRLVTSTTEQMQLLSDDKEVRLVCNCENDVIVRGDPARLKQLVVNLLDNALKYTPAGGTVCIRVHHSGQSAELSVSDTGIGIPPDALPHVFDRFYRVDKARSRDEGGAGLGLSIVKAICAGHGGTVRAASREGGGSEFVVTLPLDAPSVTKAA